MTDAGAEGRSELRHLDREDEELIDFATELISAHASEPIHTVAAVVRDAEGAMHRALNLGHFTGGPCAELAALAAAASAAANEHVAIVALGHQGRGVLSPCGRDRQVLADDHPGIRMIVPTEAGLRSVSLEALLPWPSRSTSSAQT